MEYSEIDRQCRSVRRSMSRLREMLRDPVGRKASDLVAEASRLRTALKVNFSEEEKGGYLDVVLQQRPGWRRQVERLRAQHDEILKELGRVSESSHRDVSAGLGGILDVLARHDNDESTLMQDAFNRDLGCGDG